MELDTSDLWRRIPPEEKFELMAKAQANGASASIIAVVICCTIAVGLKLPTLMWGSFVCAPFVFQYAAGKTWRKVRPTVMLEYLAARSAARRYAFSASGKELTVNFMFKGIVRKEFTPEQESERLENMVDNVQNAAVWVALFNDSLVMMREGRAGAELEFAQLLDEKITIHGRGKEYSNERELLISARNRSMEIKTICLTSRFPAALVVFEKLAHQLIAAAKHKAAIPIPGLKAEEESDSLDDSRSRSGGSSGGMFDFDNELIGA